MSTRRKSRELILQALFYREFNQEMSFKQAITSFAHAFKSPEAVWDYTYKVLLGIDARQSELDSKIRPLSSHWTLDRMALVDLIILRMACYEMVFAEDPVPPKVVINEAIEVAKKYSSTDSASFINGVLDQLAATEGLEAK